MSVAGQNPEELLVKTREGVSPALGQLLELYCNYLPLHCERKHEFRHSE